jgi:hypothetical protein
VSDRERERHPRLVVTKGEAELMEAIIGVLEDATRHGNVERIVMSQEEPSAAIIRFKDKRLFSIHVVEHQER